MPNQKAIDPVTYQVGQKLSTPTQGQEDQLREPEKVLFTWKAQERPFKKRERAFWVRVMAVASIFGLILFIAEGAMPVILLISVVFLFYILSTVEPPQINYAITNRGLKIADRSTDWLFLRRFWFSNRLGSELLVFETNNLLGRLELVIDPKDKTKLKDILEKYVSEEDKTLDNFDKASNWLSEKLFPSQNRI